MLLLLLSHFSHVQLCVTPYTAVHQALLSLGFSRHRYWSGLPFPSLICSSNIYQMFITWLRWYAKKKKKKKRAKWLLEEALQIAEKREAKSNGEDERYTHLNAELQRRARRDKKAFLSDQCKEIEENNRMGKTRYLFKKIRNTKWIFHEKMGTIKDRNGMSLTEAEAVKNRRQEYTEELYKKDLNDWDNHNHVITDVLPDSPEWEIKWPLGRITTSKAGESDIIQLSYFKS